MSSIRVEVAGEQAALIERLKALSEIEARGTLRAIGELLRSSTVERFQEERDPEGTKWAPSIRARESGGKTLTQTARLRTSIAAQSDSQGVAVGTNDIRAASLQFGDTRTIRAKNKKYLKFKVGGSWRTVEKVTIHIPARPFLGISAEDEAEIRATIEEMLEE